MGQIKETIKSPITFYKGMFDKTFYNDDQKRARSLNKSSIQRIKNHLKRLRENRDPWDENAPDMSDFDQVLNHLRLTRNQIPAEIAARKIDMAIFVFAGLWGFYYLLTSPWGLCGLPIIFLGVLKIIANTYRIQFLQNEKFVYFKDWFLGGLFDCFGKETPIAKAKREKQELHE